MFNGAATPTAGAASGGGDPTIDLRSFCQQLQTLLQTNNDLVLAIYKASVDSTNQLTRRIDAVQDQVLEVKRLLLQTAEKGVADEATKWRSFMEQMIGQLTDQHNKDSGLLAEVARLSISEWAGLAATASASNQAGKFQVSSADVQLTAAGDSGKLASLVLAASTTTNVAPPAPGVVAPAASVVVPFSHTASLLNKALDSSKQQNNAASAVTLAPAALIPSTTTNINKAPLFAGTTSSPNQTGKLQVSSADVQLAATGKIVPVASAITTSAPSTPAVLPPPVNVVTPVAPPTSKAVVNFNFLDASKKQNNAASAVTPAPAAALLSAASTDNSSKTPLLAPPVTKPPSLFGSGATSAAGGQTFSFASLAAAGQEAAANGGGGAATTVVPSTTLTAGPFAAFAKPLFGQAPMFGGGAGQQGFGALAAQNAEKGSFLSSSTSSSSSTNVAKPFGEVKDFKLFQSSATGPGSKAKASEKEDRNSGDEEAGEDKEFVPDAHFEPVIPLPDLVEVKTGEENEEVLFASRCKLFRYNNATKENKERGVGEIKVLFNPQTNRYRCVMRRDQVHKICANFPIQAGFRVVQRQNQPQVYSWHCMDYSDDPQTGVDTVLLAKFKDREMAQAFADKVADVVGRIH